eukprot:542066-Rhodomonas_salina.1
MTLNGDDDIRRSRSTCLSVLELAGEESTRFFRYASCRALVLLRLARCLVPAEAHVSTTQYIPSEYKITTSLIALVPDISGRRRMLIAGAWYLATPAYSTKSSYPLSFFPSLPPFPPFSPIAPSLLSAYAGLVPEHGVASP